jgi:hypothetical protein
MNRRTFAIEAGKAFPALAGALYLFRCGSSSPSGPSGAAEIASTSTNVNDHTHAATVPASDQLHPANKTYTSSNEADHTHQVTLTADQLSTLAAGGAVTVTSTISTTTGYHSHDFTFQSKKWLGPRNTRFR